MKATVLLLLLLSTVVSISAQQQAAPVSWQQLWEEQWAGEDGGDDGLNDAYETLEQLAQTPINLNSTTPEELQQLPFLTDMQVADIADYCRRYGPVRSLRELKMIGSLDDFRLRLLPFFTYAGPTPASRDSTSSVLRRWLRHSAPRSELSATVRLPFEERRGDQGDYLGYRYRHSLRYELSAGQRLRIGILGSQDSGEPFFAGRNRWGYDHYALYAQIGRMGILQKAIVGHYRLAAGMGLVLGSSFTLGKLGALQSLGREATTLRPHTSRSEADYFQGAALTLGLLRGDSRGDAPLTLTAFASHRPIDATLAADGSATTLTTNGYHRTEAEMARKNNTHLTAFGLRAAFSRRRWRMGLNAVTTRSDRELKPSAALRNAFNAQGRHFANASIDYAYSTHRIAIAGETALSQQGAVATADRIAWQPSTNVSLVALYRHYSYRYTGLYSHSFGNSAKAQNEQGLYIGATWKALPRLMLQAYADYAYYPWARYLASQSSRAVDLLLQAEWRIRRQWKLTARGRAQLRQRDNEAKTALTANNEYRARIAAACATRTGWSTRTQADAVRAYFQEASLGWMVSQQAAWRSRSWLVDATAAYFHTDGYAARLYLYEHQMAHEFSIPSYYGKGVHVALLAVKDLGKRLKVAARLAYTRYSDRETIGSGLQLISAPHQTTLDLQLRWLLASVSR